MPGTLVLCQFNPFPGSVILSLAFWVMVFCLVRIDVKLDPFLCTIFHCIDC